jgi:SH3-like domain-containing protein
MDTSTQSARVKLVCHGFAHMVHNIRQAPAYGLAAKVHARLAGAALVLAVLLIATASHAAGDLGTGSKSGLPVPRFVSIKPDKVNVRNGPTRDHEVTWVYTRAGLPVEITAESENWRRIRDWEGAEGWVYHSMLSGRRTAVVKAKEKDALVPLRAKADAAAEITAQLQSGVLGQVKNCSGAWCRIVGAGFDGWVDQDRLWGVYPNEKVE